MKRIVSKKNSKESTSISKSSQATKKLKSNEAKPLIADDYLILDNKKAEKPLPKEIEEAALQSGIKIYSKSKSLGEFIRSKDKAGGFELVLPEGANVGLPGIKAEKFSHQTLRKMLDNKVDTNGYRPPWVDFTPHPKTTVYQRPFIRRPNGDIIEPYYGIFGADDRQVFYPSGYPWNCIGKIFGWNDFSKPNPQYTASGVLIGGRVVLTAGHVVPWGSGNWALKFVPAFYDGDSLLGPGVSSWVSDAQGFNDPVSAHDMAVLRLYTPLGNSYGYYGAKTYNSSWENGDYWTLAGYPAAIANANRPSRQMWFPILDDDSSGSADELEYEADSTPGDSGGPVFGFWSGESWPSVVGTVSGGTREYFLWWTIEDTNVGAGGSAMVDLIKWARQNWPV